MARPPCRQWLDQSRRLSAWLSLDKHVSDPEHFLRYVIAAVHTAVPGFGCEILPLLSSAQLPPPDYLANVMIFDRNVILTNALLENMPDPSKLSVYYNL